MKSRRLIAVIPSPLRQRRALFDEMTVSADDRHREPIADFGRSRRGSPEARRSCEGTTGRGIRVSLEEMRSNGLENG
jgi:hypothetical protein